MASSNFYTPTTLTTSSVLIDTAGVTDKRNLVYSSSSSKFVATVQAIPVGIVRMYASGTAPTNYLICNGQPVSRTITYDKLYTVIGTKYGAGDGSTTFNVPNLIDYAFPYGSDANTSLTTTINIGVDSIDASHTHNTTLLKTVDGGSVKLTNHGHTGSGNQSASHTHNFGISSANSGAHTHQSNSNSTAHGHTYQVSNNVGSGNTLNTSGNHTHTLNSATETHNHNVNAASTHEHASSFAGATHTTHNYSITLATIELNHSHTYASATGVYFYIRYQ